MARERTCGTRIRFFCQFCALLESTDFVYLTRLAILFFVASARLRLLVWSWALHLPKTRCFTDIR